MVAKIVQDLAIKFVERSEALGYKGKKRDDAAIDFFCGAANALQLVDDYRYNLVAAFIQWGVSIRGFKIVIEVSKQPRETNNA